MKSLVPYFSIIVPIYNRPNLALRAIQSIEQQTYLNFECWIIEDGSTVPLKSQVIKEILKDTRFYYLKNKKNKGVSYTRNQGIKHSRGKWICFLDSDDIWDKKKLEFSQQFITENPNYLIFQTKDIWIKKGKRINPQTKHLKIKDDLFEKSLELCAITPSSVCIQKKIFSQIGLFSENLRCCEDYALWLKITSLHPIGLLNKALTTRYQGHADQLSFRYPVMDRFRIDALYQFMLNNNHIQHINLAKKMRQKKIKIVLTGAKKRKKYFFVLYFFLQQTIYSLHLLLNSLKFYKLHILNFCKKETLKSIFKKK